jgi:HEPN domain-containing protein
MTRKDLQELARLRLREAEALYKARLYDGSVYVAGYAVELALKARICRVLRVKEFPLDGSLGRIFKVHDLEQLTVLAGFSTQIDVRKNKDLFDNWSRAVEWSPEQRYRPSGQYDAPAARLILDSLMSKPNGVFAWLTKRW